MYYIWRIYAMHSDCAYPAHQIGHRIQEIVSINVQVHHADTVHAIIILHHHYVLIKEPWYQKMACLRQEMKWHNPVQIAYQSHPLHALIVECIVEKTLI